MRKLLYFLFSCIALTVTVTSCKDKGPVQSVVDQYKAGEISEDSMLAFFSDSANLKNALEWAERNKSDDVFADYILGRAYKLGLGVDRDPDKSKAYYTNAAKQGCINAMMGLANLYSSYPGYENLDSAAYWYNSAAKKGDGLSYFYLSQLYLYRKSIDKTPVDTAIIIDYWEKGMKLKDPSCTSALASAYYTGEGKELNKKKAFEMLCLINKDKLDPMGLGMLGEMYELGEVTAQNFNIALDYYRLAANKGETNAMCKLGNFYQLGQGVEKNDSLAFIQYNKAANAGNPWGQRCVALCYDSGTGVELNRSTAAYWYRLAAKNGDIDAMNHCKRFNIEY